VLLVHAYDLTEARKDDAERCGDGTTRVRAV
jgi:hypothetical protein